jgi:hypothetical protein
VIASNEHYFVILPDQTVITETSKIAEMIFITKWAVIDWALKREGHPPGCPPD